MTLYDATEDPRHLLAENRRLARAVRAEQRATWFPLLVLAAVTFAAVPVYRYGGTALHCRNQPDGGRICTFASPAGLVYWPVALVLAYVAIAAFSLHRARARGLGTRVFPYVIAGVVVAVGSGIGAFWMATHPPLGDYDLLGLHWAPGQAAWLFRLLTPVMAIAVGLLVLAVVERSPGVLVLAVVYLVFAFVPPADLGWVIPRPSLWAALPRQVIGGGILLVAALLFAVVERPRHRGSA